MFERADSGSGHRFPEPPEPAENFRWFMEASHAHRVLPIRVVGGPLKSLNGDGLLSLEFALARRSGRRNEPMVAEIHVLSHEQVTDSMMSVIGPVVAVDGLRTESHRSATITFDHIKQTGTLRFLQ
ncbi:MAG: hypothetical protein PHV78_03470 [Patescibacteria group bacterium]|nr:hypothetical protein [Patescibacteria group bacterium]MDD5121553.1 hypothetical protein [Patescibacteria group bacterium]MDD5222059.1 hypothetical protein [Patescibacteria group bacterium]MDD5396283.1 hypothetical protein [Patescibacteria group bacterium]